MDFVPGNRSCQPFTCYPWPLKGYPESMNKGRGEREVPGGSISPAPVPPFLQRGTAEETEQDDR